MEDNNHNPAVNTGPDLAELIKTEIKENLKVKVTADYGGRVEVELLYNSEVIDRDICVVIPCNNPLDDCIMDTKVNNNGIKYVDLGLPSGTLWATRNIGATRPTDYGYYFQWGDIIGYTANQVGTKDWQKRFTWNDYKFNPNGDGKTFTWYLLLNSKLELEDDAAHMIMGGDWHIPSPKQIKELIDNTTSAWTTLDDVNGMTFTSKKDSSKSIFIPAAGYAYEGEIQFPGCSSNIWSSTIDSKDIDCAIELAISYGDVNLFSSIRCIGLPVRGVINGKI